MAVLTICISPAVSDSAPSFISPILIISAVHTGLFALGIWILKTILERKISSAFKEKEIKMGEIIKRRTEIVLKTFKFIKETMSGKMEWQEFIEKQIDVEVACWFPDNVYIAVRDFIGTILKEESAKHVDWHRDAEPVLQAIIKAIRSDSIIIVEPGIKLKDGLPEYHFMPNFSTKEAS